MARYHKPPNTVALFIRYTENCYQPLTVDIRVRSQGSLYKGLHTATYFSPNIAFLPYQQLSLHIHIHLSTIEATQPKPWVSNFVWQRATPVWWVGLRATREQITINAIPNRLNYCIILQYLHKLQMCTVGREINTHGLCTEKSNEDLRTYDAWSPHSDVAEFSRLDISASQI
jgi:hypothetical protein